MVVSWKHMNGGHEDPREMMDTSHHLSRLVLNSHVPQAERKILKMVLPVLLVMKT
jgi:hypothetical protein